MAGLAPEPPPPVEPMLPPPPPEPSVYTQDVGIEDAVGLQPGDQTTLLHNEEESFALAPVDASALRGNLWLQFSIPFNSDLVKFI